MIDCLGAAMDCHCPPFIDVISDVVSLISSAAATS
jgi:hypothetical protein